MSDDSRSTPHHTSESDAPTGQIRPPAALSLEVVGETDKGRVRLGNEDNLIYEDPNSPQARAQGTLLVVSDGMGGHAAGEVASDIAVKTIHSTYYRQRSTPAAEAVRDAIVTANTAIYEAAQRNRERAGMGCTVVVLMVQGDDLIIGHVGDSRAYLIRGGVATQLTLDHSWVAMQVHEGILTPEQAEHHPNRSVLMRALGRQASVEVDISTRKLRAGDVLLVCSDGLTGMVSDAEIAEYADRIPPKSLPRQLIDLANQRGAPDNVTVLIGAVSSAAGAAQIVTARQPAQAGGLDPNATTTLIAPSQDARTPRLDQSPASDTPTDPNLPRPQPAATVPMGLPNSGAPRGSDAKTGAPAGKAPGAPVDPSGPAGPSSSGGAPTARVPRGKPVVVARTSVTEPAGPSSRRGRGRGQWIAGAVAAFGLAGALLLLVAFQGGVFGTSSTQTTASSSVGTPAPAPAATAVPPAAAAPPPAATPNPAVLLPAPAAATRVVPPAAQQPAATPTAAAGQPASAVTPTPASSPGAATNATPTLVIPGIPALPAIRDLIATALPTPTPEQRTGEAPSTSSETPSTSGPPPGDGASSTTTDPSTDAGPPAEEGEPTEPTPDDPPAEAAPGPAADTAPDAQPKPGGSVLPRRIPQFSVPGRKPSDEDD